MLPYYVSPDQMMQEKGDYARKGIARGKSVVVAEYDSGYIIMAENRSTALNKISEIYDRIAFAGVGKFSEFEYLRKEGIRFADVKGYNYSRDDVQAKSLANAFSSVMGQVFTSEIKPLEAEILVVEVGDDSSGDSIYHISFDGTITDYYQYVVMGGQVERIRAFLSEEYKEGLGFKDAFMLCKRALEIPYGDGLKLDPSQLEVAKMERNGLGRRFRRVPKEQVREMTG
ncbi:MAG: proteasome subunit alpha [Myxococcales bacterium]|nr:proteasome subunit alpha [Myxococcales bacterium]